MTPIIDTHVHVASADRVRYPLAPGVGNRHWYDEEPVTVEVLLANMDGAGVHGAVLVQGHGAYSYDNSYCADARLVAPDRLASVSIVDPLGPRRIEELTYWATQRHMGGTRVFAIPPSDPPWLDDQATRPLWERCAELGVRTNVCLLSRDLDALDRLLSWAPPRPVCLDHAGLIELPGAGPGPEALDRVLGLAGHDNLHLKVSPHVLAFAGAVGSSPAQLLRRLADTYGAQRLMWSSDWPNIDRPYGDIFADAVAACELLSTAERELFLGGSAQRIWPEITAG